MYFNKMKMLPLVWGSILLYTYANGRNRPARFRILAGRPVNREEN